MAKKRKGNNPGPVAVRRLAAKKRKRPANGEAANGEPHAAQRIIEFPQPRAADNVISDRIIFEVATVGLQSSGPRRLSNCRRPDRSPSNSSKG
jgi:hypothetical protein